MKTWTQQEIDFLLNLTDGQTKMEFYDGIKT